jgi:uncharacterized protein YyaL (SSP411 family)
LRRAVLVLSICLLVCRPGVARPVDFRFSPRPNRAHEIHWRTWDASVFAEARAQARPILLSLSAVWCHWCHVLDETTLSDPRVIARLNRDFLPVRVDADQHPDVERRYILGGWPTVAVLTPEGEIVDGGTYVPPDAFVHLLDESLALVRDGGPALAARLARSRTRGGSGAPTALDRGGVERAVRNLIATADLEHGGFGGAPKFPHADAIELLLEVGEVDLATRALDGAARLEDPVEGGFFRYATRADFSAPHYEKMLAGNAELLAAYAHAYRLTRAPRFREIALRTARWMRRNLFDEATGTLYASQDADESYYRLDAAQRRARPAPAIDRTLLADRACQAILALATAARELAAPELRAFAERALVPVLQLRASDGRFHHARRPGGPPELPGQLGDQAWATLALVALGRTADAARTLHATTATLRSPGGAFYDADASPLLKTRELPVDENAAMARAELALHEREEARKTLEAVSPSDSPGYALALELFFSGR